MAQIWILMSKVKVKYIVFFFHILLASMVSPAEQKSPEKVHTQTTISSPLTDLQELKDYTSSDEEHKPRLKKQRQAWEKAQVEEYLKITRNSVSESSSKKEDFDHKDEEGVSLPGRKRPVPYSQVNQKDRSGRTWIFKYASRGDVATSEALLRAGASLRIADNAGWTPLHEACLEGHDKIVELMLAYDAEVDAPGGDGDTPLHDAVGNTHAKVVELLLKHGASMDLVNEHEQTALEFSIQKLNEAKEEAVFNFN